MSFCVGHYVFNYFLLSFTMENSLKQFGENSKNFLCDVHKQRKLQTWVICPQNIDLDLAKMEIGNGKSLRYFKFACLFLRIFCYSERGRGGRE